jgi:hypothetical protein
MKDSKVEINGFTPTKDLLNFIDDQLLNLKSECPENSFIKIILLKIRKRFIGEIFVNSTVVKLHEIRFNHSATNVTLDLFSNIKIKIDHWKALRFNSPPENVYLK